MARLTPPLPPPGCSAATIERASRACICGFFRPILSARYDALQLSSRVAASVATVTRALDAMAPAMDEASAFAVLRERFPEKSDDEIRAALAQAAAAKEAKAAKKDGEKKKSKKDGEKKKAAASEPQTSPTKEAPTAAKSPPAVDVSDAPAPAPPPAPPRAAQPPAASSSSKKPADAPDAPATAKPTNEQDLEWKQAQNALNEANRLCNSIKKEIGGYMKRKDTVPPDLFTQKASHEAEVKRLNELIKELDMNRKDGKEQQAKPAAATTPPPPPPPTTPAAAAPATAAPSSSTTATVPPLGPPPTIHKPGSSGSGLRTLNINVGVLGHVDSTHTPYQGVIYRRLYRRLR